MENERRSYERMRALEETEREVRHLTAAVTDKVVVPPSGSLKVRLVSPHTAVGLCVLSLKTCIRRTQKKVVLF